MTVCILSVGLGVGCGNDSEDKPASRIDQAVDLDCTDESAGRPDYVGDGESEIYVPTAIKRILAEDEVIRERFGADQANSCDDARRFTKIFREEGDRFAEEWLERNPPDIPAEGEAPEADPEQFPVDDPPVPDDEQAAAAGGAGASGDAGAAAGAADDAADDAAAAAEIEKINNGFSAWAFYPTVKIVVSGRICSANVITNRHLVTSAHCVKTGQLFTAIYWQQWWGGMQPTLLFKGSVKVDWTRQYYYTGPGQYWYDIAVGKTVNEEHDVAKTTGTVGMYWGTPAVGQPMWQFGYGAISPNAETPGIFHWGEGKVSWAGVSSFGMVPDAFQGQTTCKGDSGGFTGSLHGNSWFTLDGLSSESVCGKSSTMTRVGNFISFIKGIVTKESPCSCGDVRYASGSGETTCKCK